MTQLEQTQSVVLDPPAPAGTTLFPTVLRVAWLSIGLGLAPPGRRGLPRDQRGDVPAGLRAGAVCLGGAGEAPARVKDPERTSRTPRTNQARP